MKKRGKTSPATKAGQQQQQKKPPGMVVTTTTLRGTDPATVNSAIKHTLAPILRPHIKHVVAEICSPKLPDERRVAAMCSLKDVLMQTRITCGLAGNGVHICSAEEQKWTQERDAKGLCMGVMCIETITREVDYVDLLTKIALLEAKFEAGSTGSLLCVMLVRDIVFFLEHYVSCCMREDHRKNGLGSLSDEEAAYEGMYMTGDVLWYGETEEHESDKMRQLSELCAGELGRLLHRNLLHCTKVMMRAEGKGDDSRRRQALEETMGRFVATAHCANMISSISESTWQTMLLNGAIYMQLRFLLDFFLQDIDEIRRTHVKDVDYIDWRVISAGGGGSSSSSKVPESKPRAVHVAHGMGVERDFLLGAVICSVITSIQMLAGNASCMPFVSRARAVACGARCVPDIFSPSARDTTQQMMKTERDIILHLSTENHMDVLKYMPYLQRLRGVLSNFVCRLEKNVRLQRLCMCALSIIHEFDRLDLPKLLPPEYATAYLRPEGGDGGDDDDELNRPEFMAIVTRDMLMPRIYAGGGPDDRENTLPPENVKNSKPFICHQMALHYASFAIVARKLERLADYLDSKDGGLKPPPHHLDIDAPSLRWMLQTAMELDATLNEGRNVVQPSKLEEEEGLQEINFCSKKPCLIMEGLLALAASGGTRGIMYFWRAKTLPMLVDIVRLSQTATMRMYATWILSHMLTRGPHWKIITPEIVSPVLQLLFEPERGVLDELSAERMNWADSARAFVLHGALWNALMVLEACRAQNPLDFRADGLTEEARKCNAMNAIPRLHPLTKLEDVPGHPYNDTVCALRSEIRVLASRIAYVHLYDFSVLKRPKKHSHHAAAAAEEAEEDSEEGRKLHAVD